ncbi:hypothetical protein A3D06_02005 [Candidatus Roizmanbacteria bacterium RIFCSPHIGHO2_02_FULL_40_9]|uniref:Methyltransferase domain-containing protein n=2 Tax=Candidatus Roizmaniibacteriota TaxID=1752723 RepID=A0A1F7IML0_9BACT|nr:MAG: hypothetical protein A3D06_02005 [Candidatus Roizmanbacteria bacterium RIFCSPHIGHO2_02_FULL_40_9]OGK44606.1 MAG: hypothetical protein A2957_00945 [Candidatus Roizmanbacteria bacterium RIFCSPLOWO2_01_FULL_38_11]
MVKYGKDPKYNPDERDELDVDRQSLSLIPHDAHVLDIGCATGFMGVYLKETKGCHVVGLEYAEEEAKIAKKKLDGLIHGDASDPHTINRIQEKFDVILASAILEHLSDPARALHLWKRLLRKNGCIIATTPNIAHWSMRLNLLRGKFDYEEYGILDKTHLRFFTLKTFRELFEEAGCEIDQMLIDPVGGGFPRLGKLLYKLFPGVFAYQMIIRARPRTYNSK